MLLLLSYADVYTQKYTDTSYYSKIYFSNFVGGAFRETTQLDANHIMQYFPNNVWYL